MTFKAGAEYALRLSRLGAAADDIARKAIYEGARIVADAIAANLAALPVEKFRRLKEGEKFDGLPIVQKKDLIDAFGVASITVDGDGNWNTKLGFDGYGRIWSKAYPDGLPNQLLARSVESGSSVRQKHPFVRPAVRATREPAVQAMNEIVNAETQKIME